MFNEGMEDMSQGELMMHHMPESTNIADAMMTSLVDGDMGSGGMVNGAATFERSEFIPSFESRPSTEDGFQFGHGMMAFDQPGTELLEQGESSNGDTLLVFWWELNRFLLDSCFSLILKRRQ